MQIFNLKFFSLILFLLINANTIYAFDKNSVKKVNTSVVDDTTQVSVDTSKKIWTIFHNQITFFRDNTLVVPIIAYDQSQKKYLINELGYVFVDCRAPGVIFYNSNLENPTNLPSNTAGGLVKNFFCKSSAVGNEKVLWTSIYIDQVGFDPYVLHIDSIRIDNDVVFFKYSSFDRLTRKLKPMNGLGSRVEGQMNCSENFMGDGAKKKYYSDSSHDAHFLMDTLCRRNDVLKINNIIAKTQSFTKDINQKCTDLGLTVGTVNYENCVLQLLDE